MSLILLHNPKILFYVEILHPVSSHHEVVFTSFCVLCRDGLLNEIWGSKLLKSVLCDCNKLPTSLFLLIFILFSEHNIVSQHTLVCYIEILKVLVFFFFWFGCFCFFNFLFSFVKKERATPLVLFTFSHTETFHFCGTISQAKVTGSEFQLLLFASEISNEAFTHYMSYKITLSTHILHFFSFWPFSHY